MGLTKTRERGIAVLRVVMGLVFLYAGTEKLLAIGVEAGQKWSALGFLKFASVGTWPAAAADAVVNPTHAFWVNLAGNPTAMSLINILVPFGEFAIGIALVLGLGTRVASLAGTVMLVLFAIAGWDFGNGILNEQVVFAVITAFLGVAAAGEIYGLDAYLNRIHFVQRTPQLRYVLG